MTRKDYQRIANSIMAVRLRHENSDDKTSYNYALTAAALDLAASLQEDNPRFDRARFLAACGVTFS